MSGDPDTAPARDGVTSMATNQPVPPSGYFTDGLAAADPEVFAAIAGELGRQQDQIELIASENMVSLASLQALGSVMTNKTVEGYPGRPFGGGAVLIPYYIRAVCVTLPRT